MTKASDQESVSLGSLIDRAKVKEEDFKSFHIVQIPFKEETNTSPVILSDTLKNNYNAEDITMVKKYLVLVKDIETSEEKSMVTTFVPTARNIEEYGEDSFSYLDKSTFEGIVINSNLDGSFRSVYIYGEGHPILDSYFCRDGEEIYGKLVAYTGRTGNAYNVDNKHLHLTYHKNWVLTNPEEILNGKVDWNETMTKVLTEGLKGIKCDSERLILGLID